MIQPLNPLTLPLDGHSLIEAGAGTGKTYTLSLLYLRFILGHGTTPLLPPQILVMTFTKAATAELRDRLRKKLVEAKNGFRSPEKPCEKWLEDLKNEFDPKEFPANARKLELAEQLMSDAAISTIHGWCQQMLRKYTFAATSLTIQEDDQKWTKVAAADYWRIFYSRLSEEVINELPSNFQSPQRLTNFLSPILDKHTLQIPEGDDPREFLPKWVEETKEKRIKLKNHWKTILPVAKNAYENWEAENLYNKTNLRKNLRDSIFTKLQNWLEEEFLSSPQIDFSAKTWWRFQYEGLQEIWKNGTPPRQDFFDAFETLESNLANLELSSAQLLPHAILWIRNRRMQEKEKQGVLTYDDLLLHLHNALKGENTEQLAAAIRQQFPVALIDEFQDTDPLQYAIFDAIYNLSVPKGKGSVIFIGDPKQAIYSFRGADIFTYLHAKKALKSNTYTLDTNYRSTKETVEAVNTVFSYAENNAASGAFGFGEDLQFLPVQAAGIEEKFLYNGEVPPPITVWEQDEDDYKGSMAKKCAAEIARLLHAAQDGKAVFTGKNGTRPLSDQDMVVLVNSAAEAQIIIAALHEFHLAGVYFSQKEYIFESPVCGDLLIILQAIEQGGESLCRQALATSLLGIGLEEQEKNLHDEAEWEKHLERFSHYRQIRRQQGILPLIIALIHDYGIAKRLLNQKTGERHLTDLLHLGELLQEKDRQKTVSLTHLFRQGMEDPTIFGETAKLRLPSESNCIAIMTVHKAKGLEFPLVFYPFPVCKIKIPKPPCSYHDQNGQPQIVLDANEEQLAIAQTESRNEDLRKFYVAMTRSRHAIWLGLHADKDFSKTAMGYFFAGFLPPFEEIGMHADTPEKIPTAFYKKEKDTLKPPKIAPIFSFKKWQVNSYSSLTNIFASQEDFALTAQEEKINEADEEEIPIFSEISPQGLNALPPGPQSGTLLHKLLELACEHTAPPHDGFLACLKDNAGRQAFVRKQARLFGQEELTEILDNWLKDFLQTPLQIGDDKLILSELPQQKCKTEMEFMLGIHETDLRKIDDIITQNTTNRMPRPALLPQSVNGMIRGFIDLVFELNGRYFIADWKSNFLGYEKKSYEAENLIQAIHTHRYDVQYSLYLLALHRHLRLRLPKYSWEKHIGGAAYVFLRGKSSVFWDKPPFAMIEELDSIFTARGEQ